MQSNRQERKARRAAEKQVALYKTTPPLTLADIDTMMPTAQYTPKRKSLGSRINAFRAKAIANHANSQKRRKLERRTAKLSRAEKRAAQ